MLVSSNLHNENSDVSIKTRSPPASISFEGKATKHTFYGHIQLRGNDFCLFNCSRKGSLIQGANISFPSSLSVGGQLVVST